jgi:zinc transport system ATP-binding protein
MALISCQNLAFGYEAYCAVKGLNFRLEAGDYLCVVGENGSGKSTLLKGLLGLLSPQEGKVLMGEGLRADEIGYMPQYKAAHRDFPAEVREVALSGRLAKRGARPFYSREDKKAAAENMERMGIGPLAKRRYGELSGGQQQRALLARALCAAGRLLFLDEPAAGLDPLVTADLYRLIESINRETGLTIVMVSHDIRSAVKYAGRILHLKREQLFFGTKEDYIRSEPGREFLGSAPETAPEKSAEG